MKKNCLYILILILGLFSRNLAAEDNIVDSITTQFKQTASPEDKIEILLDLVTYCIDSYDERSLDFINLADSIADANDMEREKAIVNLKFGYFWRRFGSNDLSIIKLNEALLKFEELGDKYHIGMTHRQLGETYRPPNKDSSLHHLDIAYRIFLELNDTLLMAKTLNRFGAVYFELRDKPKSISYIQQSLDLLRNIDDEGYILNNYILLIANYRDMREYEKAESYVDSAKSRNIVYPDKSYTPYLYSNIAMMEVRQGKYKQAINTINECFELCEYHDLPISFTANFHHMLAESYLELGDYEQAAKAMFNSTKFKDSMYKNRAARTLIQQQMLGEADKVRQKLEFQESLTYLQLIIFFGALAIIGLVTFIISKRNRDMRKINSIISEKNTELQKKNEELHDLNATKDKFFSIIAHDLKNPIGSFRNITQVLSKEYHEFTEEDKIEFINSLRDSSKNLYDLLENLLTWSRSQRGVIECNPDQQNLAMVIQNTLDHLTAQAMAKSIQLENNIPLELEAMVDANLTSTVVRNLVSNSIKYSEDNTRIEVNSKSNGEMATIEIRDYGVGMDEEACKNLFRIDNSKSTLGTKGEKGTGLGLIVCKEFIDKQGGDIWVESVPGEGSSFFFTVRLPEEAN